MLTQGSAVGDGPSWIATRTQHARDVAYLGFLLFKRDFQYRFKLTYFGYAWACFKPLLAGVPLILIGRQFNFGSSDQLGISYPLYAFVGLLLWQTFWDALFYPQWTMRRTRKLLCRARFPYKAVLVAGSCYVLFNVVIYVAMLMLALVVFGARPGPEIVLGIAALPLLIISGLSIGAFLAPMILVYLDLRYGLPVISSVMMWTVPAVYVTPESGLLHLVNTWNPATYLVSTPRIWLTGAGDPQVGLFLASVAGFSALCIVTMMFYERTMRIAVDQIL